MDVEREHLESLMPEKWRGKAHLLPLPESHVGGGIGYIVLGIFFAISLSSSSGANSPLGGLLVAIVFIGLGIWTLTVSRLTREEFVRNFSRMTMEERDAYMAKREAEADSYSGSPGWPKEYETEEHIHYRPTKPGFERGFYGPYRESGQTVVRREKKK